MILHKSFPVHITPQELKNMLTGNPFDDLLSLLSYLPEADQCAAKNVRGILTSKPLDTEGGLADLAQWLAMWQGSAQPSVAQSHICLFASSYDGGGAFEEVVAYVDSTAKGAAPVNLLCVDKGIGLRAIQLAPELPHKVGPDWSEADCMAAVAFGMEATAAGGNLLALADLAPGNDEYGMAVILASLGQAFEVNTCSPMNKDVHQAATGIMANAFAGQADTSVSPLEAMRRCGGREIAASVGAILAARSRRLPVVAEGWGSLAAVVVLEALRAGSTDHVRFSAADAVQLPVLEKIGKQPLLQLWPGAGPGAANALAISILSAACGMVTLKDKA